MTDVELKFSGPLTLAQAGGELARQQALLKEKGFSSSAKDKTLRDCRVVADLSDLTDVDTSALAVLIALNRDVMALGAPALCLKRAPESLLSLAKLSSLATVFDWENGRPA